MNKFVVGCAVASTCIASAFAGIDGTGTLSQSIFSAGNGGEFTAAPSAGYLGQTGLPADLTSSTFQTFCMETNEQFSPGGSYDMCINIAAIAGGSGGPSFALQPETAYLYYNFRMGTLFGYDYTPAGRQASAAALQQAIWFIQGNQPGGANNAFVAAAFGATSVSGGWSGIGDVRVLNVYGSGGALGQDQLTIIPTPGAAALVGLGGLMAARRRR